MMIFSDTERTYTGAASHAEPIFTFLDRSAREPARRVRELIESWFERYPTNRQKELLSKLRNSDDSQFLPAFFELYIHELLIRLGYRVTIHPELSNGVETHPDFLAVGNQEEFFIEVITPSDQSKEEKIGEKFINPVLDKVNEVQSDLFFAHIRIRGTPIRPLKSRYIRDRLRNWINQLDYDELIETYKSSGIDGMPSVKFDFDKGYLEIKPIPKNNRKMGKIIGSYMSGGRWMSTAETIRRAINKKQSKYGELGKPYILAINVLTPGLEQEDIIDALYGSEKALIDPNTSTAHPLKVFRANDGAWSPRDATKLSGIFITSYITPWTVASHDIQLFLNPWAVIRYQGRLEEFTRVQPQADGKLEWIEGIHPRCILNLPNAWPENDESMSTANQK